MVGPVNTGPPARVARTVVVNFKTVSVPAHATAAQVIAAALAAGVEPSRWGAGGVLELRAYIGKGGAAVLMGADDDTEAVQGGRKTYKVEEFGLRDAELVEPSNALGSGRGTYWPASPGRQNRHQVRAAVLAADPRYGWIWRIPRMFTAPEFLRQYSPDVADRDLADWTVDRTGPAIIRNARGAQFDNEHTLAAADADRMIAAMIRYAKTRIEAHAQRRKPPAPISDDAPVVQVRAVRGPEGSLFRKLDVAGPDWIERAVLRASRVFRIIGAPDAKPETIAVTVRWPARRRRPAETVVLKLRNFAAGWGYQGRLSSPV